MQDRLKELQALGTSDDGAGGEAAKDAPSGSVSIEMTEISGTKEKGDKKKDKKGKEPSSNPFVDEESGGGGGGAGAGGGEGTEGQFMNDFFEVAKNTNSMLIIQGSFTSKAGHGHTAYKH